MRDAQRRRVYEWEKTWRDWNRETLTLGQVREHVCRACRKYGLKPPAVRSHKGRTITYSQFPDHISFQKDHKNPAIALHEAAHFICDSIFGTYKIADHCPEWLGIYMSLLEDFKVAPRSALHASAREHRLRWLRNVSPKAVRARARRA